MGVTFGSFDSICQTAALVICPLVGTDQGIEPSCYSRNVDVAGTLIFQPCQLVHDERPTLCRLHRHRLTRNLLFSNMFRPHCRNYNDSYNDIPYTKQIYRRW